MIRFTLRYIVSAVLIMGISTAVFGQEAAKVSEKTDGVFRAVHLLNLKSADSEAEFLAMLNDLNEVIAELGYSDIRYSVWKERGDRGGQYKYLFESTWPDQATYDKVHESEEYRAVFEKHNPRFEELIKEDVYSRYVPVN